MTDAVDNLQSNPTPSTEAVTGSGFSSEDFFASLDTQVNGMLADEPPPQAQVERKKEGSNLEPVQVKEQTDELRNLEKRYVDSSREAKRLNKRNKQLEEYAPILDRMRQDPGLSGVVQNYIEGNGVNESDHKKALNLPEDFVFDADDAISNPNSDSGKVLNNLVDGQVKKRVSQFAKVYSDKMDKSREIKSFVQRHNMNKEQYQDFVNYAQSRPLSLDDIYTLKNLENRDANIAQNTRQEMRDQMENVRQRPSSVASSGEAQAQEQSPDQMIFDAIKNSDIGGLESLQ
tara:strand:- start:529 stop:1392 length:864 start_codon:yes stop_codon:yes gene_type:complete